MTNIINGFDIGKNKVRVGFIEFSGSPKMIFDFNRYSTKAAVVSAIQNTRKSSGGTRTDWALNLARDTLFQTKSGKRYWFIPH